MLFGTILCLGDSLTFGARDAFGPPERLATLMTARSDGVEWAALNRGISGQTTREILDRAPAAVAQLVGMSGPKWVTVLAGTNDSKGGGMPIDAWETLFRQLLHWPRRYGMPIAVCTFPPVRAGLMPAYTRRSKEWLVQASDRVRAIAAELDCAPSPVRLVELADIPKDMLCDGVHMSPGGNDEIARRIAEVMLAEPEVDEVVVPVPVKRAKPRASGPVIDMAGAVAVTRRPRKTKVSEKEL